MLLYILLPMRMYELKIGATDLDFTGVVPLYFLLKKSFSLRVLTLGIMYVGSVSAFSLVRGSGI